MDIDGLPARLQGRLVRGRAMHEATMLDLFTVAGLPNWVTVDGLQEEIRPTMPQTVGQVTGRAREGDSNARTVLVGEVEHLVIEAGLKIPISAQLPEVGWQYTLLTAGPETDPALLGRTWQVVDVPVKSHAAARRLDVVEV